MKQMAILVLFVLLSAAGTRTTTLAYNLDTPHNESNGIYCYTCHYTAPFTALWSSFSNPDPEGDPDNTMRNAICLVCHGQGATHINRGPAKKPHSSTTTSTEKGIWTTECTQCHDVHSQGQLDYANGIDDPSLFLVYGWFDTTIEPLTFHAGDTEGGECRNVIAPLTPTLCGTTTVGIRNVNPGGIGWGDTSKWGAKGGFATAAAATDNSRGLVLVASYSAPTQTFEIISVTGNIIKVKGKMTSTALVDGQKFAVIYGQSIKSLMMPNGGTALDDMREIKFFKPEVIAGNVGGYIDNSGSDKPKGLCQVCHDGTAFWKNDGSSTDHYSGTACGECHNILTGLGGGAAHNGFISDRLESGCGNCHLNQVIAPESGHSGGCNTCHLNPKPAINSNILTREGGVAVHTALINDTYSFAPRLTDDFGKTVEDDGFQVVDCSECHELKRAAVLAGSHGGHGATTFGWDSNCDDCHGPTSKEVASDVHCDTCITCHDPARVAAADYTVRIAGNGDNGVDGSAVGATRLSNCSDCHNTDIGEVHHLSRNGYAAAGQCTFCHATTNHLGNHTDLVVGSVNCTSCHNANVGNSSGAPVDPADNKKHDSCLTCHNLNSTLKSVTQVASPLVVTMPDGGGSCVTCHDEYFSRHSNADHQARVAGNLACNSCHSATAGTATTVPTSTADNKLHHDCYTCHQGYGALKAAYGKAQGMAAGGGDCTICHGGYFPSHQINHATRVAATTNCTGCHPATAGDPISVPINLGDNKVHDACATCHDSATNNLLKSPYGKAPLMPPGGGDCNGCHGAYFVNHAKADHTTKVAMNASCAGCHEGTQGTAIGVVVDGQDNLVHSGCTSCHSGSTGALVGLAADHTGGGDCLTCHAGHDTNLVHDHRVTSGLTSLCTDCHAAGNAAAIDTLHGNCETCHNYAGNRLNPATVAAVIAAGKGVSGSNQNCQACHTVNLHHTSREAANNSCTTTCHLAVDHSPMVVITSPCSDCHTASAGTMAGVPVSFSNTLQHQSCRSCHTFDTNLQGILVNFTNKKGVNGSGPLPNGGGTCTVCHTVPQPSTFHHTSPRVAQGQCEYCHVGPMPSWSQNAPGDNGTLSGLTPAWPTQMACRECHVTFTGSSMTVTKFTRADYANYATGWTRTTAHTLPMTGTSINNYGICLGCHFMGSTKVPASAQVALWHARPDRHGASLGWAFYDQPSSGSQGKSNYRSSCAGDQAHYAPGRSSSGIGGFNIFAPNYGRYKNPLGLFYDFQNEGNDSVNYCADYDTFSGPAASAPFIRITLPPLTQLGTTTPQALPVFASISPASGPSSAADEIKVLSAVWNGTDLHAIATTTNSSGCATLTATYNGHNQAFAGTTACVATFPESVVYTSSLPTLDVTTSNPSGMNVSGYEIREILDQDPDTTPPIASGVFATPSTPGHVPTAFTLTTDFVDDESAVTGCEYTTDGMTWTPGITSGSTLLFTCTANPSAMSGALSLNMRAITTGGLGTASAIARAVDATAPGDGVLTVTAGYSQNSLSWTPATDGGSGLRTANAYDLRFQTGATPPSCTSGTSLYQGVALSHNHNGLSNGTPYSYRVCAYDNLNNLSTGATGSGAPHDVTPPDAGTVSVTPVYGLYVPTAFTMTTSFTDAQSAVTGCEYTTNGSTWTPGLVSGSSPSYTCTANPIGMSGALSLNMRATSTGGLRTASPLSRTVDLTPPTDGALTVTAGSAQNILTWTNAADSQSGLRYTNRYNVRFLTGATAPTCTTGTLQYQGTLPSYTHTGLAVGTQYSYRVCAHDNLNNVSAGATGSAIPTTAPPTLASPTATAIAITTATLGANVTVGGDTPVTARGTVWGTSANPTGNLLAEGGTTTGTFSQTRTGLPAGANIYYRGYATNSSTVTGYSPGGSFYTEPSSQASGVGFAAVGQTGLTVNWTRGTGDGVIVLMKQGAAVNAEPVDGTFTGYTASSVFGSGAQIGTGNYVVYKGPANSVAVTGLLSGTSYSVAVYEYKGTINSSGFAQGTNYKPTAPTGNQTTLLASPILTTPTATTIGSTTATLGANVTFDSGASITTRGTVWGTAANPAGNLLAEGGTTTGIFSQARTGLPAGAKIYYRGYATNSQGTGYSPDGSFYTEPAGQASGVNFSTVGSTGLTVNWTRGNGDGVVVLMKQGAPVNADPVDGTYTGYSANSAFGFGSQIGSGNFVIYKGAATSVAVTGLNTGATYYVAVYEYKGTGDTSGVNQGTNYKPSPVTGSQEVSAVGGIYSYTFNYTGSIQNISIPAGATNIQLMVKGAGGGGGREDNVGNQENGQNGHLVVRSSAVSGQTLRVYVGGGGLPGGTEGWGGSGGWGYHLGGTGGDGESAGDDYCWGFGGAGGGGSSAILLDSNATVLTEAAGGPGGRSSDWDGDCYDYGGPGGAGGGADNPGTTDPTGGGVGGLAGGEPQSGGNGQVVISYESLVPSAPVLSSPTATTIGSTTATLGANITASGGAPITARGTVWGTAANPTTYAVAEGGATTGVFNQARTGLPPGAKIYYRGYATTSAGTSYSPDGSFYTEPATQASGVNFTSVFSSAMTVNWARGSGDGVIVLMKQGSAVNTDPTDGTSSYPANTAFGSGMQIGVGNYVVYKGTGTSVVVTGLTATATYYVAVYEYKGMVDTSGVNQGTNFKPIPATGNRATGVEGEPHSYTFNYTGSVQTLPIPAGATNLQFTVKGGGGGGGRADNVGNQASGQNGHLVVMPSAVSGLTLRIYVGGGGAEGPTSTDGSPGGWGYRSGGTGGYGESDDCDEWAYGGAGGGGSSAILLDSNGNVLTEAAGGAGGRSSDWDGECYYTSGGPGGAGGGSDNPGVTDPTGGGAGGLAGGSPSPGGNGQIVITYESLSGSAAPTLSSPTATTISSTTATLGANLTASGGAPITARGTVWGTAANPTTYALAEGGATTGVFNQARTGLPPGAKIYYRGYATNSAGTGYSPDGSFYTEPATQASGVSFSAVGSAAMTVNWTRGNGDGVIVLMKQGSAVNTDPADGTSSYTANTAFGSGTQIGVGNYVVYKGAGSSVAVSGLTPGATYYLAAYEYQGSVDTSGVNQGTNYKTSPAAGNQGTATGGTATFPVSHMANCYSGQIALDGNIIWAGPYLDQYDECDVDRTLLMFDTSALGPGATVTSARLYLDYQISSYLSQDAVTEVHQSTWVYSTDTGNCNNVGAYLNSNTVATGQSFGLTDFAINSSYINKTGSTLFAVRGVDEGICDNVDPGYNRATSYLEVQYTTN